MSDILIVDDERDIRELISEILIDEGTQPVWQAHPRMPCANHITASGFVDLGYLAERQRYGRD